jgi:putative transposase
MSRRRNFNVPGHAHELTFSCYHQHPFLTPDRTCTWLAEALDDARREWDFALWAYVFMPEHVHLIVFPRRAVYDIADIRQAVKEPVARKGVAFLKSHSPDWLERITVIKGDRPRRYFWQPGGGYDRNIEEPRTLMSMIDYIHMNPVRRGLVQRAVDWKWSSASWFLEQRPSPVRLDPIPPEWIP